MDEIYKQLAKEFHIISPVSCIHIVRERPEYFLEGTFILTKSKLTPIWYLLDIEELGEVDIDFVKLNELIYG